MYRRTANQAKAFAKEMFCPNCGKSYDQKPNYCSECGRKLQEDGGHQVSRPSTTQNPTIGTFLEYRKCKGEERAKFSCGKKSKPKICKVQINIGLMTLGRGGVLKPWRGRSISLSTHPDISGPDLLDEAVRKMRDFNKDLDEGPFLLLYPDGSEVINIPGTQIPFSLKAYKEEIGKQYQRIVIFICQKEDFEKVFRELPDTFDSDPEIVIKTTRSRIQNQELDLADTLVFEPPHKSSPVHEEPDQVNDDEGLRGTEVHQGEYKARCVDVESSCYRKYTNLFAPIVIDDDEDEVVFLEEKEDMPSEKSELTTVQASEIIANLALAIDHKKVSRFNISRSDVWDGAVRGFRRSSYYEKSDIFVKFTDDAGSFEEGLDTGGPRREFLTLLMTHLRNRPIFDGPPEKRYLVYNPSAVREDEYYLAGKMIAVSIVHGGPAPHFVSKDLVNHIIGKPGFSATVEDVKDEDIGRVLHQVQEAESEESLQNIILQNSSMFQTAGCFRPVKACQKHALVEEYLKWYIIDRNHIAIQRFKDGLASLEFLASVQKHPDVLSPLLCYSTKTLTASEIEHLFSPGFSTKGSNRWQKETKVIGFWADFLMECEDEVLAVSLQDVLMFATGLSALPPAGITPHPTVEFLNDSPLPMATTCSNTLKLPLLDSYSVFTKNMEFGILNAPGFGCF
ncbi:G2/M phase-specific E3 ubiquitin-protein ligase-like [Sardina pilchardus]|uniref:G2/M phase-specific E3 ubiquitin-protein ligase-like n=1 Tax=Sardina pilchardus TaxID=27697 RepID=UPI002E121DFF